MPPLTALEGDGKRRLGAFPQESTPIIQYAIDRVKLRAHCQIVAERDLNEEAARQVTEVTGCPPPDGEELIESEELKRQFRQAKEAEKSRDC